MRVKGLADTNLETMDEHLTANASTIQQQRLLYPPYQYFFHHSQITQGKQKLLSSLQQMGVDIENLIERPMQQILKAAETPLKKSYSVKVVAVKDGEIGVLSKRIEMKSNPKKSKFNHDDTKKDELTPQQSAYVINNYFYPKFLKGIKKQLDPKDEEQKQKLLRWQAEQYEKFKGKIGAFIPEWDDSDLKLDENPKVTNDQLVIAGLGALKKKDKILPSVKRLQVGQNRNRELQLEVQREQMKNEYRIDQLPLSQDNKKLSYSRLLSDLTDRDLDSQQANLFIQNKTQPINMQTPQKSGGIIYELEEENEQSPQQGQVKFPQITRAMFNQIPSAEQTNLQKRIKRFKNKLNQNAV